MRRLIVLCAVFLSSVAHAQTMEIVPQTIPVWKSIFGTVDARDRVRARARIGGTIVELEVTEGDRVEAGQRLGMIVDDKLQFQIDAIDAQLEALRAQLGTAESELSRGEALRERGVLTVQRLEQLQSSVDVLRSNILNGEAQRLTVAQQIAEGEVLSPETGIVLSVPVSRGSVINPGETLAEIAGGGTFLRLNIPERHAASLSEGDEIAISGAAGAERGRIVKLYPLIEGGRLQADVEVEGLDSRFIGRRVPLQLSVGARKAILVPQFTIQRAGGLDFVAVETADGVRDRVVVPGDLIERDDAEWVEILSGIEFGDLVVIGNE